MLSSNAIGKQKLTRRGRKLAAQTEEKKIISSLPKDVPERIWSEVLSREDLDLFILDIREEIIEKALEECYRLYMERQKISYTVDCMAKALIRILNLHYYRHDPGDDPSVYPPVDVPSRILSWTRFCRATKTSICERALKLPDAPPEPSPIDTWSREAMPLSEMVVPEGSLASAFSMDSITVPEVEPIPDEYKFPGKVRLEGYDSKQGADSETIEGSGSASREGNSAEVEVLEKVTDYDSTVNSLESSQVPTTSSSGSCWRERCLNMEPICECKIYEDEAVDATKKSAALAGAGDAPFDEVSIKRKKREQSLTSRLSSIKGLPSVKIPTSYQSRKRSSDSLFTEIKLRSLRLDLNVEVGSEHFDENNSK